MLDMLERSNLFLVSLDDQRLSYRYQHLFGELLHEQLTLRMPERVAGLHRAASGCFAGAGRLDEAIGHTIAAQDLEAAADLVVSGWGSGVASGRLTTVLGWLETFPDGYVKHSAPLSVISAWVNGLLGHHVAARRSVEDMLAAGSPGPLPDGSATVEHAAALFRSMFSFTDVSELRSAARAVREFRGELRPPFQAVAAFTIGLAAFLGGDYEEARAELQRAAKLATALGVWIIVIDALGISAQVALTQSRTEDAEALALRSVGQAQAHGLLDLPHVGYYLATVGAAIARSGRLEEGDDLLATGIGQLAGVDPDSGRACPADACPGAAPAGRHGRGAGPARRSQDPARAVRQHRDHRRPRPPGGASPVGLPPPRRRLDRSHRPRTQRPAPARTRALAA